MNLDEEIREVISEPLEEPVPGSEHEVPSEPLETPVLEPVLVP